MRVHAVAVSATVPAAGGTITITIGGACGSQTVTALTFVPCSRTREGQVVLDGAGESEAAPRTDDLTIGRRVFTVRQAGVDRRRRSDRWMRRRTARR